MKKLLVVGLLVLSSVGFGMKRTTFEAKKYVKVGSYLLIKDSSVATPSVTTGYQTLFINVSGNISVVNSSGSKEL